MRMRWLTLLMTLPPTPTRHRVGVWRKLQRMGAVRLRGSAWILPENGETTELFQWLVQEVRSRRSTRSKTASYPITCTKHTPNMQGTLVVLPKQQREAW
jgi:hypothetical protein